MLDTTMQHADELRVAPSHDDPAAPSQHPPPAFSLQEAAAILGVSLNTLRRRIDAGQVKADKIDRPQGHVWRVYLDGVKDPPDSGAQRAGNTLHQEADSTLQQPATSLMQAEAMAVYTRSVLEPLVTALERSEDRARELERENGRLGAELERAAATVVTLSEQLDTVRDEISTLEAQRAPQSAESTTETLLARFRACALWVFGVLASAAVVVLLGWLG